MDEIFDSNLKDKFFDIVFNANQSVVKDELEDIFKELIAMRLLLEQNKIDQNKVYNLILDYDCEFEAAVSDFYIDISGKILSNNE